MQTQETPAPGSSPHLPLDHYLALEYEVRMVRRGDRYLAGIPELGLHLSGSDPTRLLEDVQSARVKWIRELYDLQLTGWIIAPGGRPFGYQEGAAAGRRSLREALTPFAIKALVVSLMLLLSGLYLGSMLSNAGKNVGLVLANVGGDMERNVHNIAKWPDEKVEKTRIEMRGIVTKLTPVAAEFAPLFQSLGGARADNATANATSDQGAAKK